MWTVGSICPLLCLWKVTWAYTFGTLSIFEEIITVIMVYFVTKDKHQLAVPNYIRACTPACLHNPATLADLDGMAGGQKGPLTIRLRYVLSISTWVSGHSASSQLPRFHRSHHSYKGQNLVNRCFHILSKHSPKCAMHTLALLMMPTYIIIIYMHVDPVGADHYMPKSPSHTSW